MKYYIDSKEVFLQDGAVQFIHSKGDEFIICGAMISPVNEEENSDFIKRAQEVCGIDFLLKEIRPEQIVYPVPYCNIFAQDSEFFTPL